MREVVEAWEAVNVLSDVFLDFVRGTRGILGRDNRRQESAAFGRRFRVGEPLGWLVAGPFLMRHSDH